MTDLRTLWPLAALAVLALVPLIGSEFYIDLAIRLSILGLFALSLDLLVGYTGLVSLGHAAFFGLGGYLLALMSPETKPAVLLAVLPLAIVAVAVVAAVIGWFSVRTAGAYFIMITLAFAQMLYYLVSENSALGGSDGLFVMVRPTLVIAGIEVLDLGDRVTFFYVALAALVGGVVLLRTILNAPFGQVLAGIRINEPRTRALGYSTHVYKLVSFVIAACLAGVAGFLEGAHAGYVSPGLLSWHHSGLALVLVILGGKGTLYGPILGAFAFGLLEDQLQEPTRHWPLFLGGFIIVVVLALPQGIVGVFRDRSG